MSLASYHGPRISSIFRWLIPNPLRFFSISPIIRKYRSSGLAYRPTPAIAVTEAVANAPARERNCSIVTWAFSIVSRISAFAPKTLNFENRSSSTKNRNPNVVATAAPVPVRFSRNPKTPNATKDIKAPTWNAIFRILVFLASEVARVHHQRLVQTITPAGSVADDLWF